MNKATVVRGLEIMPKKKKSENDFVIIDVGPSSEESNKQSYETYVKWNRYRDGKSFREILDRANSPHTPRKKRTKSSCL